MAPQGASGEPPSPWHRCTANLDDPTSWEGDRGRRLDQSLPVPSSGLPERPSWLGKSMQAPIRSNIIRTFFYMKRSGEKEGLTVSAPAVYKDIADHLLVNFSCGVSSPDSSSRERNDESSLPWAIWCFTNAYGFSITSMSSAPHCRAIFWNPAPGIHSGRYLTNTGQSVDKNATSRLSLVGTHKMASCRP